jgi:hypothetical protein
MGDPVADAARRPVGSVVPHEQATLNIPSACIVVAYLALQAPHFALHAPHFGLHAPHLALQPPHLAWQAAALAEWHLAPQPATANGAATAAAVTTAVAMPVRIFLDRLMKCLRIGRTEWLELSWNQTETNRARRLIQGSHVLRGKHFVAWGPHHLHRQLLNLQGQRQRAYLSPGQFFSAC